MSLIYASVCMRGRVHVNFIFSSVLKLLNFLSCIMGYVLVFNVKGNDYVSSPMNFSCCEINDSFYEIIFLYTYLTSVGTVTLS